MKNKKVIGYKGFNKDMTCRGYQYEIGKEYKIDGNIELCEAGFHFCKKIEDVKNYYSIQDKDVRICEVEALGKVIEGDDKCVTDKIKIVRELTKDEMYELGNNGTGNRGFSNTGDYNTGDCNTGYRNTGDWNTGGYNTGDCNTGGYNTEDYNTGDWNAGNYNTGDCNTGYRNTGDWNTGDWNTGYRNTGYRNTGYCNTGDWNTGNYNTGDWNKTNRSSGVFCNEESKLKMFNKDTDMTWEEWRNSEAFDLLTQHTKSQWIWFNQMTDEEKKQHTSAETCGGYLKEIDRKIGSKDWWEQLEDYEKETIIQIPNFDLEIFNDIMELHITKKEYNEIKKRIDKDD